MILAVIHDTTLQLNGRTRPGHRFVAIRPEDVLILLRLRQKQNGSNTFTGKVEAMISHGFVCTVQVNVNGLTISALVTRKALADRQIREGETVSVFLDSRRNSQLCLTQPYLHSIDTTIR